MLSGRLRSLFHPGSSGACRAGRRRTRPCRPRAARRSLRGRSAGSTWGATRAISAARSATTRQPFQLSTSRWCARGCGILEPRRSERTLTCVMTCSGWLFPDVRHVVLPASRVVHARQDRAPWLSGVCVLQVRTEADELWTPDTREGHAEIRARGAAFLRWLLARTAPQSTYRCVCAAQGHKMLSLMRASFAMSVSILKRGPSAMTPWSPRKGPSVEAGAEPCRDAA